MLLEVMTKDQTSTQERVRLDCATFLEWESTSEPYYDAVYGRGRQFRTCYDMRGQSIFVETYIPWNVFSDTSVVYKLTDFNIPKDSLTMAMAEEFNGEWEEGYYAEEGYGWPVFSDAEHAWNFLVARETANSEIVHIP
jgi:hypothetical protein